MDRGLQTEPRFVLEDFREFESSKYFLPTGLLDLRAFDDSDDIKLASLHIDDYGDEPFLPRYVTLSHFWGPPERPPITTTRANLQERMTRISIGTISNTFRDAICITRELGERYL